MTQSVQDTAQPTASSMPSARDRLAMPILSLPEGFTPEPLPARTITAEQQQKLDQLREHCVPLLAKEPVHLEDKDWLDDACRVRYLRATRWNVDDAIERIAGTLQWRHERRPHMLDPTYVEPEAATGKLVLNGFDRYGRPVLYLVPRRENTKASQRQIDHLVFFMERAIAAMPPGVEQLIMIIDFAGASMLQSPGVWVARETARTLGKHYPERLAAGYIVGAPWFFGQAYKLVAPFLDEVTQKKVNFIDIKVPDLYCGDKTPEQMSAVLEKEQKPRDNNKRNSVRGWMSFGRRDGDADSVQLNKSATFSGRTAKEAATANASLSGSLSMLSSQAAQAPGVTSPLWDTIPEEMLDAMVGGRRVYCHDVAVYWQHLLVTTVNYTPERPIDASSPSVAPEADA